MRGIVGEPGRDAGAKRDARDDLGDADTVYGQPDVALHAETGTAAGDALPSQVNGEPRCLRGQATQGFGVAPDHGPLHDRRAGEVARRGGRVVTEPAQLAEPVLELV